MKRLLWRWFLVISVTVVAAMLLVNHIAFMSIVRQMEEHPRETFKFLTVALVERLEGKSLDEANRQLKAYSDEMSTPSEILPVSDPRINSKIMADFGRHGAAVNRKFSGWRFGLELYIPVTIGNQDRVVLLGPFTRPFSPDVTAHMYMGFLVLILLIASALVMSLPMINRLRKLEKTARSIADGDLAARVPIRVDDSLVGFVAQQFNTMADRIEQLLASQKMMLQAVAHELRTPTARIRFGLEMLENTDDPEQRTRRMEAIDEDLTDLDDLVEELLIFNKAEALGTRIETVGTPVMPALRKLVDKRGFIRPGVEVVMDGPGDDLSVGVDPRAFLRATGNLLSNALRFSRSRVLVSVREEGGRVRISVCDDGPGVPVSDRETIFQPFKRLDDSRNRESGGAGLGLAIVNSIVSAHSGRIEVAESAIGGASFTVWWPKY